MKTFFAAAVLFLLASHAAVAGDPLPIKVGDFTFRTLPGSTVETPIGAERARLAITGNGEQVDVTFYYYGFKRSGTENVAHWFEQFSRGNSKHNVSRVSIGSVKITYATTQGTYSINSSEDDADAMRNYALCGAVLEGPRGDVYVKMIGYNTMVKGATEAFKQMISDAARTVETKPLLKKK